MDRRSLLTAAAFAGGAATVLSTASTAQAATWTALSGRPGRYAGVIKRLTEYVDLHRRTFNLPSLVLSIADGEGFSALITAGFSDVERRIPVKGDQLFQIGSISKSMTALALLRLSEAGRLDLQARVADVLPAVALAQDSPVTLLHLIAHTGGLPDNAPIFPRTPDGLLFSDFEPGSRWSYSNTGYDLLGRVVEEVTGKPLPQALHELVLDPLGMERAAGAILQQDRERYALGYRPWRTDRPYPRAGRLGPAPWIDIGEGQGSVAASAPQMVRFLTWLIAAGNGKGGALLSDAAARRYTSPLTDAPDWEKGAKYGFGLAHVKVSGRTLLHHTGGMIAFSSALHVDPAAGVGAFASTNVGMTGYRPRAITAYACELMRAARERLPEPRAPSVLPPAIDKPQDYVGRFTAPGGEVIDIRRDGAGLTLRLAGGAPMPLEGQGPGRFLALQPRLSRYVLAAERDGDRVRSLWWGPVEYAADPAAPRRSVQLRLGRLAGRYDNDSPWQGTFRIVARPDGLSIDGVAPLVEGTEGVWRVAGDPPPPERLRFEARMGGQPYRLNVSGTDFIRRSE